MKSYTKGEWIIHEWGDKFQVVESQVRVEGKPGITMAGQRIIAKEITEANAQLIASAPKLVEFLGLYLADCQLEHLEYNDDTYNLAIEIGKQLEMPEALTKAETK